MHNIADVASIKEVVLLYANDVLNLLLVEYTPLVLLRDLKCVHLRFSCRVKAAVDLVDILSLSSGVKEILPFFDSPEANPSWFARTCAAVGIDPFEIDGQSSEAVALYLWYVCNLLKKFDTGEIPGRKEALDGFVSRISDPGCGADRLDRLSIENIRYLLASVLGPFRLGLPKHGPGAVAGGQKPWEKWNFGTFYERLNETVEYDRNMFLSPSHLCDELHLFLGWPSKKAGVSKMHVVPKDFSKPRIICAEPLEYQWAQQASASYVMSRVASHPFTKGSISFHDQTPNQRLACEGSINGRIATIDLSNASDGIKCRHIVDLFPQEWSKALLDMRTPEVSVDGTIHQSEIFATMGNALCFPIETLLFWAVTTEVVVRHMYQNRRITHRMVCEAANKVRVFGDDILCPAVLYSDVEKMLTLLGFEVNRLKSYHSLDSRFRESCGGYYLRGKDITPIQLKQFSSHPTRTVRTSLIDQVNRLNQRGCYSTAQYILDVLESVHPVFATCHGGGSLLLPYAAALDWNSSRFRSRFNKSLQRREFLVTVYEPARYTPAQTWSELFKSVMQAGSESSQSSYPVPHRVRRATRWTAFY